MLFTFYREKPQLPVSGLTGTHTGTISGTTFTKTWDLFVEYDAVGFSGEFSVKIIMEEDIDLGTCNFVHFEINGKEYTEEQVTAFLGK